MTQKTAEANNEFEPKAAAGKKGSSQLSSDFARIAISAAGEQDLEGRFRLSLRSRRLRFLLL
jgi:hypothetical protein